MLVVKSGQIRVARCPDEGGGLRAVAVGELEGCVGVVLGQEGENDPVQQKKIQRVVLLAREREIAQKHELRRPRVLRVLLFKKRLESEPPEPRHALARENGAQGRELLLLRERDPEPLRQDRQDLDNVRTLPPEPRANALERRELSLRCSRQLKPAWGNYRLEPVPNAWNEVLPRVLLDVVEPPEKLLQRPRGLVGRVLLSKCLYLFHRGSWGEI